ncbi:MULTISPECIES: zinc ABC transporter ATP-binding protein AztA [unclassified Streptomyces]|uniref:zinc ABC transporter ATP-binding protein AztA n=1 Tax=unclassified Streptomyces TaxID=2593676 RepID=UPI000CD5BDD6|nr:MULTISPECIES: zinc ABC transporter ATP-binding protein AztA [unclassified Streptomyces]
MSTTDRRPRVGVTELSAGYARRTVLSQLTAQIPEMATTVLVGPNGSGKSTLFGVIAGVIRPTAGSVHHHGTRRPAFVPQRGTDAAALPLTVRQTVEMGRWADRGPWRRLTRRDRVVVDAALERLGIAPLAGRQLAELSGGQRQRALVAQGVAQESDLLLLDEPGTGLDLDARRQIDAVLTELASEGVTVVQATHDLEAARRAEHCLLLSDGLLFAQGPPAEVLTERTLAGLWQPAG